MRCRNRGVVVGAAGILAVVLIGVPRARSVSEPTTRSVSESTAVGPGKTQATSSPAGVCPPFYLRDEDGQIINPAKDENVGKPYSPKMTCGTCHDYEKITQGFHFTQGMGEAPTAEQTARCLWASTPGNFGGNWCSPAPLYRYLSPKTNESAVTMDLTAFTFFTSACGACHPGGGSAEHDREGKRYDRWMSDPQSGLTSKGNNNLDGDYYQARWSETGVLEADCLLCHMPGYDVDQRKKQLGAWNFRWAATAGSKFASVQGSVQKGEPVEIAYHKDLFNPDGTIEPHIVREPRNEACLGCHAQPAWKKRGANFSPRTDVHLRGWTQVRGLPSGGKLSDRPAHCRPRGTPIRQGRRPRRAGSQRSGRYGGQLHRMPRYWQNGRSGGHASLAAPLASGGHCLSDLPHSRAAGDADRGASIRRVQPGSQDRPARQTAVDLLWPGWEVPQPLWLPEHDGVRRQAHGAVPAEAGPLQGQDLSGQSDSQRLARHRNRRRDGLDAAEDERHREDVDGAPGGPGAQVPGIDENRGRQRRRRTRDQPRRRDRRVDPRCDAGARGDPVPDGEETCRLGGGRPRIPLGDRIPDTRQTILGDRTLRQRSQVQPRHLSGPGSARRGRMRRLPQPRIGILLRAGAGPAVR